MNPPSDPTSFSTIFETNPPSSPISFFIISSVSDPAPFNRSSTNFPRNDSFPISFSINAGTNPASLPNSRSNNLVKNDSFPISALTKSSMNFDEPLIKSSTNCPHFCSNPFTRPAASLATSNPTSPGPFIAAIAASNATIPPTTVMSCRFIRVSRFRCALPTLTAVSTCISVPLEKTLPSTPIPFCAIPIAAPSPPPINAMGASTDPIVADTTLMPDNTDCTAGFVRNDAVPPAVIPANCAAIGPMKSENVPPPPNTPPSANFGNPPLTTFAGITSSPV